MYDRIAELTLDIDDFRLDRYDRETSSDFTRTTTVVSLSGNGVTGRGEDVTYETEHHAEFASRTGSFPITGTYTFGSYADHVADLDLFPADEPTRGISRNYRRWAFESAGLDLALKQDETSLGDRLERRYRPVRFVVSTRLGDPPRTDRLRRIREIHSDMEFKLDPISTWKEGLVEDIPERDSIVILDLKGQYDDTIVDQDADPELYELVIDSFPRALIEDPNLTPETESLFVGHEGRVSWDYPITGVESIDTLPWMPEWLNIKPSRFGSVRSLFDTLDFCEDHDIRCYGGGQFELDVGRDHLQALASLFYPDSPNDVAPRSYNDPDPRGDAPASPLAPPASPRGLEWS